MKYKLVLFLIILLPFFAPNKTYAQQCSSSASTSCNCPGGLNYECSINNVPHNCILPNGSCVRPATIHLECECGNRSCRIDRVECVATGGDTPTNNPNIPEVVTGKIVCKDNNSAVANANVFMLDSSGTVRARTRTDENGRYSISTNVSNFSGTEYALRPGDNEPWGYDKFNNSGIPVVSGSGCSGPHENCKTSNLVDKTLNGFDFYMNSEHCPVTREVQIRGAAYNEEQLDGNMNTLEPNWYGTISNTACNGSAGRSGPNYTISWNYNGNTGTQSPNVCQGNTYPTYYFQNNPVLNGTSGQADITITVHSNDPAYGIIEAVVDTGDYNGNTCKPSQRYTFSNSSLTQTLRNVTLYSEGDCKYTTVWFRSASDAPNCSGLTGPFEEASNGSKVLVDRNNLVAGKTYYFNVSVNGGSKNAPATHFTLNNYRNSCSSATNNPQYPTSKGYGTYEVAWTAPATPGTYNMYGQVWNNNIANCKADCVSGGSVSCENANNCKLMVTVNPQEPALTCQSPALSITSGKSLYNPGDVLNITANIPTGASVIQNSWTDQGNLGSFTGASGTTVTYTIGEVINRTIPLTYTMTRGTSSVNCTHNIQVGDTGPAEVDISFDKELYDISITSPTATVAKLTVDGNPFMRTDYTINLSCPPSFSCRFTNNSTQITVPFTGVGENIQILDVLISTSQARPATSSDTIEATGRITINPSITDTAIAKLRTLQDLDFEFVKISTNDPADLAYFEGNNSRYCDDPDTIRNNTGVTVTNTNEITGTIDYADPSLTDGSLNPANIYKIPHTSSPNTVSFETNTANYRIMCVLVKNPGDTNDPDDAVAGNSASFNMANNTVIYVAMAPITQSSWFQAYGGNIFARSNIHNQSLPTTSKTLVPYSLSEDGVFSIADSRSNKLLPSIISLHADKFVEYLDLYEPKSVEFDDSFAARIGESPATRIVSNFSNIDFNDTDDGGSAFYFYDKNLTITNASLTAANEVPVIFVDGNVTISKDVNRIDAIILSTESITVNGETMDNQHNTKDLIVNGALISQQSIVLNRNLLTLTDPELMEKVYFRPEIFLAKGASSMPFKVINVYASEID